MQKASVYYLGKILAVQAEVEGMKAENAFRERRGESIAYGDEDFNLKAYELRQLADYLAREPPE